MNLRLMHGGLAHLCSTEVNCSDAKGDQSFVLRWNA